MTDESSPPERSTPYGTSDINWRRTASSSPSRSCSMSAPLFFTASYCIQSRVYHRVIFLVRTAEIVPRQERIDHFAYPFERFEFRGDVKMVPFVPAHVERDDPHVVTGHQVKILFAVIQCECEDTVQLFQKIDPLFCGTMQGLPRSPSRSGIHTRLQAARAIAGGCKSLR